MRSWRRREEQEEQEEQDDVEDEQEVEEEEEEEEGATMERRSQGAAVASKLHRRLHRLWPCDVCGNLGLQLWLRCHL